MGPAETTPAPSTCSHQVTGRLAGVVDSSRRGDSDTARSTYKTLKLYQGYYHDPLNDVGKETVMADIQAWIDKRLQG